MLDIFTTFGSVISGVTYEIKSLYYLIVNALVIQCNIWLFRQVYLEEKGIAIYITHK